MSLLGLTIADGRLIINIFKMNIRDKYLGSSLGLIWAILNPLLLLGMYTFIFGFVFKAKIPGSDTTLSYAIWMISGLMPYMAIAEGLNTTASSVISGAGMVKNVVFKSETLVYGAALTALVPLCVGMLFLVVLLFIDGNYPSWHIIGLVPLSVLLFLFLGGAGLMLSATTVFIRDIVQGLTTAIMFLMFFTPIFYTKEMLPGIVRRITFFNPLYQISQPFRDVILYHRMPDKAGLIYMTLLVIAMNIVGLRYFRKLKGYFETRL